MEIIKLSKSEAVAICDNYGYVYVLTNRYMPHLVKIGMTTRNEMKCRMDELYSTGVPAPFDCAYACRVPAARCAEIEQALHQAFKPYRVNLKREFFEIEPEQAIAILKLFNTEEDDVTEEVQEEIEDDLTEEDRVARDKAPQRRPNLNFATFNIPVGDLLYWKDDSNITAKIVSDKKVLFNGEEMSLTNATRKVLGKPDGYQISPGSHWLYKDETIDTIYNRYFPVLDY